MKRLFAIGVATAVAISTPYLAIAQTQASAPAESGTQKADGDVQPEGITVSGTLSNGEKTQKIRSNTFSPSTEHMLARTGNFADPLYVGFVVCEQGKRNSTGIALDSTAATIVKAANRKDTEVSYSVNFPLVSQDWIDNQNKFAQGGGCGYFKDPKIVVLNVKGNVPFKKLASQYVFTGSSDGYTLTVEVKPQNK